MKAYLVLEDGTTYEGESMGALHDTACEVVFNTGMTGYLEVLTDPSYAGQGVVMTYPLIGNYGVCYEDMESLKPYAKAFIVKEIARLHSNFRSEASFEEVLKKYGITGISGIDTRALTRHLRTKGTMRGVIVHSKKTMDECKKMMNDLDMTHVVVDASIKEKEIYPGSGKRVALLDLGYKKNILRSLQKRGLEVYLYPAETPAEEILADRPDGIMLSNGPGDPKDCGVVIENIKKLVASGTPIFGICLGHQLTALAHGFDTAPLKYGHRGANHPVKDLSTGRVYITSQNHGYMVVADSVDPSVAEVSHVNANDQTVEGVRYKNKKVRTVQFHPEASPGPKDTAYLFDEFVEMMGGEH